MAFGLYAYNNSGSLVIDSSYQGMSEVMSGTLSVTSSGSPYDEYGYRGTISVPSKYSHYVITFRPHNGSHFSVWGNVVKSPSSTTIPYKVFATTASVGYSSDSYGMRVWNSGGSLVFDSGHRMFNVISTTITTAGNSIYVGSDWVVVGCGGLRGTYPHGSFQFNQMLTGYFRKSGDRVYFELGEYRQGPLGNALQTGGSISVSRVRIT